MQPKQPQKRQLRLEMPRDASAIYSNTVMVSHTMNEVILDFIQIDFVNKALTSALSVLGGNWWLTAQRIVLLWR